MTSVVRWMPNDFVLSSIRLKQSANDLCSFIDQVETEATMEGDAHVYTLSLQSVTEAELGNYTCTASNELGTAEADFELTDVPSDPVVNADPSGADFTAFTLTWTTETFYPVETVELIYRLVKVRWKLFSIDFFALVFLTKFF